MIANGSMQRDEFKQRLVGGDPVVAAVGLNVEADDWEGSSQKDPWLVEIVRASPWNKWSLVAEEGDITEMPMPPVGNQSNVAGLCQRCFHACSHHICTECGASEYFPEAECGIEGCVRSFYSFHPECHCRFQPRCRKHAFWECTGCSPGQAQSEATVSRSPMELLTGACGEESAKSKSVGLADVLESEQRRAQLAQMGCRGG
jgi:hypothetical protein